jgi:hypothetical protein
MSFKIIQISFLLVAFAAAIVVSAEEGTKKSSKYEEYGTVIGIDLGTTYSW